METIRSVTFLISFIGFLSCNGDKLMDYDSDGNMDVEIYIFCINTELLYICTEKINFEAKI